MSLVLRYAARSDRGLIRGNNQDSVYAGPRLLAVADGMGGHAAGDVASKVVIAALEHLDDDAPSGDMLQAMRAAVFEGSEHLREVIRESPQLEGMGTTLTAILFAGGRLALCHVGDSRAYLVRDGQLSQITHDDTFVQTLIDDGRITAEEANTHPQRSLLLRALNGQEVEPDLSMREARDGDRYLLCSDGLSGVVSEETIAEALKDPDPESTADRLIELALRSGGPDNVTVIVADVIEDTGGRGRLDPVVDGAAGDNVGQRQVDRTLGRRAGRARRSARAAPADTHTADGRWPLRPPPPAATSPGGGDRSRRARGGCGRYVRLGPRPLVRRRRRQRRHRTGGHLPRPRTSRSSASTSTRSTRTPAWCWPTSRRRRATASAAASPPTTPATPTASSTRCATSGCRSAPSTPPPRRRPRPTTPSVPTDPGVVTPTDPASRAPRPDGDPDDGRGPSREWTAGRPTDGRRRPRFPTGGVLMFGPPPIPGPPRPGPRRRSGGARRRPCSASPS